MTGDYRLIDKVSEFAVAAAKSGKSSRQACDEYYEQTGNTCSVATMAKAAAAAEEPFRAKPGTPKVERAIRAMGRSADEYLREQRAKGVPYRTIAKQISDESKIALSGQAVMNHYKNHVEKAESTKKTT